MVVTVRSGEQRDPKRGITRRRSSLAATRAADRLDCSDRNPTPRGIGRRREADVTSAAAEHGTKRGRLRPQHEETAEKRRRHRERPADPGSAGNLPIQASRSRRTVGGPMESMCRELEKPLAKGWGRGRTHREMVKLAPRTPLARRAAALRGEPGRNAPARDESDERALRTRRMARLDTLAAPRTSKGRDGSGKRRAAAGKVPPPGDDESGPSGYRTTRRRFPAVVAWRVEPKRVATVAGKDIERE